jgi:hypothetical protein
MSESNQTDHWDLLASALGAEPRKKEAEESPTPGEEKNPDAAETSEVRAAVGPAPKVAALAPLARPASNWDAIALSLGIEVKADELPPAEPEEFSAVELLEPQGSFLEEVPRELDRPSDEQSPRETERYEKTGRLSVEEPAEQREKKSHRRKRRRRKDRDKDRIIAKDEKPFADSARKGPADNDLPPAEAAGEGDDVAEKELGRETDAEEIEQRRLKHRRSRRGSRKRKNKAGEPSQGKAVSSDRTESAAVKGSSQASGSKKEITKESKESIEEEEEDHDKGSGKSAFRAIPTWEEAIGIVITKNMESRPRRHGSGSSSSRTESREKRRR